MNQIEMMNISKRMIFTWMLMALFSGVAIAAPETGKQGPVETLQAYCAALEKGDIETADSLTARSAKLPEASITQYNTIFSKQADSSFQFTVHDKAFVEKGDCAAVLCDVGPKGSFELMRAFLVKQDGKWKVYLKFWVKENAWYPLEGQQEKDAVEVEAWCVKEIEKKA